MFNNIKITAAMKYMFASFYCSIYFSAAVNSYTCKK